MMVSTKGRYALRVMIDLAEQAGARPIPLRDIAKRQDISLKYLESIVATLSRAGLVEGQHGKGGGYRLTRPADEYTVGAILRLTEGSLAPVACLEPEAACCARAAECKTLPMWRKLDQLIGDYLDSVTIASLAGVETGGDYVI